MKNLITFTVDDVWGNRRDKNQINTFIKENYLKKIQIYISRNTVNKEQRKNVFVLNHLFFESFKHTA